MSMSMSSEPGKASTLMRAKFTFLAYTGLSMLLLARWLSISSIESSSFPDGGDGTDLSLRKADVASLACTFCRLPPTPRLCAETVEPRPGCGMFKVGNAAGGRLGLNGTVFGLRPCCGRGLPVSPSSIESSMESSHPWRSETRDASYSSSPYRTGARILSRSRILLILAARWGEERGGGRGVRRLMVSWGVSMVGTC